VQRALAAGLTPIVCVGEKAEERDGEQTAIVLRRQLLQLVRALGRDLASIVVAYEPVWAIGSGDTASPGIIDHTLGFIADMLVFHAGLGSQRRAHSVRRQRQPAQRRRDPRVRARGGCAGGGAALKPADFMEICKAAARCSAPAATETRRDPFLEGEQRCASRSTGRSPACREPAACRCALAGAGMAWTLAQMQESALLAQRLEDVARASGDWIWETDAQHRYTWVHGSSLGVRAPKIGELIPAGRVVNWLGEPELPRERLSRRAEPGRAHRAPGHEEQQHGETRYVSRSAIALAECRRLAARPPRVGARRDRKPRGQDATLAARRGLRRPRNRPKRAARRSRCSSPRWATSCGRR
jgi:PAS domain-containing protein